MSTFYWVGGTGTWDNAATAHWSATSGGAAGAGPPTAADDVIFDTNSMPTLTTVTINGANATCKSLTVNLPAVLNLVFSLNANWTTNGNVVFNGGSAITHPVIQSNGTGTSRTWTINGTASFSNVDFMDIVAAGTAAPFGAVNLVPSPSFEYGSYGPAWQQGGVAGTPTIDATQGFAGTHSARSVSSGAGSMGFPYMTPTSAASLAPVVGGAAYSAGVYMKADAAYAGTWAAQVYWYDSTLAQISSTAVGPGVAPSLAWQRVTLLNTVAPVNAAYARLVVLRTAAAAGEAVNADAAMIARGATLPPYLDGDTAGCFWLGAAGSSTSSYTLGDCLGNSSITFPPNRKLYWVAVAGGGWNLTTSWSTSSGGASGAAIPLPQDDCVFDANSITSAGRTITVNVARTGRNVDFSAVRNQPAISFGVNWNMFGDLIFGNMTISGTSTQSCRGRNVGQKFDPAGLTFTQAWAFLAVGGSYVLQNDYTTTIANTVTTAFQVSAGGFDANGHNVTANSLIFASGSTVNMGSGTWTITGAVTAQVSQVAQVSPTCTLNPGTSTLVIADTSATGKLLQLGGKTFYNLTISPGGTGPITFIPNAGTTFNTVTITGPKTVTWPSGQTQVASNWVLNGSSGNLITMNSSTPGTRFTLTQPYGSTGTVWGHYMALQDSLAGPGFYAGNHSVDNGNNSGWIFTDPPKAPVPPADPLAVFTPAMIVAVETSVDDPPVLPALIFDVPQYERTSYEVKAVLKVIANELYRLDVARHALIQNFFPLSADVLLGMFEQLLGLPVNPPATLAARQQLVAIYMDRLKSEGRGLDWVALITQAVGTQNWNYAEHDPANPASPPAYTVNVNIPQQAAGTAWPLIRDITPAHLTVNEGYTGGFVVGVSPVGNNL